MRNKRTCQHANERLISALFCILDSYQNDQQQLLPVGVCRKDNKMARTFKKRCRNTKITFVLAFLMRKI